MSAVADDILVAYPPVGTRKAERLAHLDPKVKLTVALDSVRAIGELAHWAHIVDRPIGVLIEMDLGFGDVRTALNLDRALRLIRAARRAEA